MSHIPTAQRIDQKRCGKMDNDWFEFIRLHSQSAGGDPSLDDSTSNPRLTDDNTPVSSSSPTSGGAFPHRGRIELIQYEATSVDVPRYLPWKYLASYAGGGNRNKETDGLLESFNSVDWGNALRSFQHRETSYGDDDFTSSLIRDSLPSSGSESLLLPKLSPENDTAASPEASNLLLDGLRRTLSLDACPRTVEDHVKLIRALARDVDLTQAAQPTAHAMQGGEDDERHACRLSYMLEQIVSLGKPIEEVVVEMRHSTFVQSLALARTRTV